MKKQLLLKWVALLASLSVVLSFSSCSFDLDKLTEDLEKNFVSSQYEVSDFEDEQSSEAQVYSQNEVSSEEISSFSQTSIEITSSKDTASSGKFKIPTYSGEPYAVINNNTPSFSKSELTTKGYEKYSDLDSLGRCGVAIASCGEEIMPRDNEKRGSISNVTPTGWVQAKYDMVSGKYLYNRSHLIGWQLSAENANAKNLITGTRYMNVEGMLPFENMVADYIEETGNHVAYRITPIFEGNNLLASGVQMEAYSVEDNGDGICFNVYCFNVQPDVEIDYSTGASKGIGANATKSTTTTKAKSTTKKATSTKKTTTERAVYITPTGERYHFSSTCGGKNSSESTLSNAKSLGLTPCKKCANG